MAPSVVLFDRVATVREPLLREYLDSSWQIRQVPDPQDSDLTQRMLAGATAFIGNVFDARLGAWGRTLRLVQCLGAGVDLFEQAAIPPGCCLCNVYQHEVPIAEYIILNILTFATKIREHDAALRRGIWMGSGRFNGDFHGEASGRTLGLIGFGHIGRETARRARALGMRVIAVRRTPQVDPDLDWCGPIGELSTLLSDSDYVAVVCPLTPETQGLLDETQLRRLKPTAVLINVSRAAIIEEAALYRALRERWIAGAALDVWYQYPAEPGAGHGGSVYPFHEMDHVVITPHFSAWTEPMMHRRFQDIARNLDHLARGEPLERIVYRASDDSQLSQAPD